MLIETDPYVLFECDYCKNIISPNSTLINVNDHHFCSLSCSKQYEVSKLVNAIFEATARRGKK